METITASATSSRGIASEVAQEQLFVVVDRAHPVDGGARHALTNVDLVTIGRGAAREAERSVEGAGVRRLRLAVPDERVSARHARLEHMADGWRLVDCNSTNGTRVNQRRVGSCLLVDGDLVEIGHTFFRYRAALPTPVGAPADLEPGDLKGLVATFATLTPRLAREVETLERLAKTEVTVLLLGETGTGKEVLARAVHEASGRSGAFVGVNCGAIPAAIAESLLFGHKRGAFSGALKDEPGLVRAARGGTLFLDEIGDLAASAQAAMLRVLQEREVTPLGETRPVTTDVRVVAATHRPLSALVQAGGFREDLLARISGYVHQLPPLRDRVDDLGLLLRALLSRQAHAQPAAIDLSTDATYALLAHTWPFNVRELEQRLRTAMALAREGRIQVADLWKESAATPDERKGKSIAPASRSPEDDALHAVLVEQLTALRGNVTHVAQAMGKSRTQIQRWVRRLGIDATRFRP